MSKRPSAKTKAFRKMGEGVGADYIPYITTSDRLWCTINDIVSA